MIVALCVFSCQSSERKIITLKGGGERTLAVFSSAPEEPAQVKLQLLADSTFQLAFSPREGAPPSEINGKIDITQDHYRLFFPDTVRQLNQLLTSDYHDASVVVYPDRSVAFEKALRQFYIRGVLVSSDTLSD